MNARKLKHFQFTAFDHRPDVDSLFELICNSSSLAAIYCRITELLVILVPLNKLCGPARPTYDTVSHVT
jgi:hypothetical protein